MNRKTGRNKRRRMGRLLPITLKERDKREERAARNDKPRGIAKIVAKRDKGKLI